MSRAGSVGQSQHHAGRASARPDGYFWHVRLSCARWRTARDMATMTALVRVAERFEALAAQRLALPDDDDAACRN